VSESTIGKRAYGLELVDALESLELNGLRDVDSVTGGLSRGVGEPGGRWSGGA
jgi:hypothetical protein